MTNQPETKEYVILTKRQVSPRYEMGPSRFLLIDGDNIVYHTFRQEQPPEYYATVAGKVVRERRNKSGLAIADVLQIAESDPIVEKIRSTVKLLERTEDIRLWGHP